MGQQEEERNEEERKRKRRHLKPVKESSARHVSEGQDVNVPCSSATSSLTTIYFLNNMIHCYKNEAISFNI